MAALTKGPLAMMCSLDAFVLKGFEGENYEKKSDHIFF
jgi:hypothetical protein